MGACRRALGDTVTWRGRHFGIPFTMTSAITAYEAPHRFVDEQVRGPFRRWWHEHTFVTVEERGGGSPERTLMIDRVPPIAPRGVGECATEDGNYRLVCRVVASTRRGRGARLDAWLKSDPDGPQGRSFQ